METALLAIPAGRTASYSELARRIGAPRAVRAVGAANGSNPVAIVIPCHRVIGADGGLIGYGGGIDRKRWLLEHEGVLLKSGVAHRSSVPVRAAGRLTTKTLSLAFPGVLANLDT